MRASSDTVEALLTEVVCLGVKLTVEPDDRLRYRPKKLVNDSLLARLREHKPAILDALRKGDSTPLPQHANSTTAKTPRKKQLCHTHADKNGSEKASDRLVLMPFGKFKGHPVDAVPLGYLIWAWEAGRIESVRLLEAVQSRLWEVGYWNDHMKADNWPEGF